MSSKPNKTVLGAFVLGAVALGVAAVILLGSGKHFSTTKTFVLYFPDSVTGLSVGSPVVFRGVPLGSVTDIEIQTDLKTLTMRIPVTIEIDPSHIQIQGGGDMAEAAKQGKLPPGDIARHLIAKGLRARLGMQSVVTGQLMIFLDFMPEVPARLHGDGTVPEIPTAPSPFDELTQSIQKLPLRELTDRMLATIEGIDKLVNSAEVTSMTTNLSDAAAEAKQMITEIRAQVNPLTQSIDQTTKRFGDLAANLDGQVGPMTKELRQTLRDYSDLAKGLDSSIDSLTAELKKSLKTLDAAIGQTGGVVGENSPLVVDLKRTLDELSRAARSIRIWAEYLERHPEAIIRGKGDYRR